MTFIVKPSRPGSRVAEAFALKEAAERRMKRIASMTKTKPAPPEPSKTPQSPRAKGGTTKKAKP